MKRTQTVKLTIWSWPFVNGNVTAAHSSCRGWASFFFNKPTKIKT
jgi:hypothetical protein